MRARRTICRLTGSLSVVVARPAKTRARSTASWERMRRTLVLSANITPSSWPAISYISSTCSITYYLIYSVKQKHRGADQRRRTGHESRNVRDLGTRGAPDRLAGRDRDEGRRARADLGRRPRSAREQRGQRDLGPGRLSGRGEVRDGCRRVRRGGHRDRRPAQGLVCTRLGTGTSHRSTCWRAEGSPRSPRPEIWRSSSRFAPRKTTSSRSTRTGRSTSTISTRRRGSSSSPAGHTRQAPDGTDVAPPPPYGRWPIALGGLQIVAGVRLVERLVAEGKIRNDGLEERVRQRPPVQEGRIEDVDALEHSARVHHDPVDDRPPPAFHQ